MPRCTENEMPTLSEYFLEEARALLNSLEQAVTGREQPDPTELHRAARGLRGTAQMAREDRIFRAAAAFENVTRSVAAGALGWSQEMTSRALDTISDLRALLERQDDDEALDARADATTRRWSGEAAPRGGGARTDDARDFHEFAAREAAGIAEVLDLSIRQLQADPMDREPLRAILRRQRALLGAARLAQIPVVAEVLGAIEDLTRVIAKLDVGVKQEWLDIYRVARDGLQGTIAALVRGENPEPANAVSRLRHMRAELLERYGEGEAVSAAHDTKRLVQATPLYAGAAYTGTADAPVPESAAQDDAVLELNETSVTADADDGVLELSEAVVQDDAVLELSEPAAADDAVLELTELAAENEEPVLELTEAAAEDEAVLELYEPRGADDTVLELSEAVEERGVTAHELSATDGDILELTDEVAAADGAVPERDGESSRDDALRRALQLRDTIMRVAAHDPQARRAVDELFDLIRTALG
jgi:chemotaxis protein histidine kinase CheA